MLNLFRGGFGTPFLSLTSFGKYAFATKMQAGSTKNKKDSAGKRLGVKRFGGHEVYPDDILVRQRGFRWHPGKNTYYGKDHTIHSKIEGVVKFEKDPWRKRKLYRISVEPREHPNRLNRPPPGYCYHPELFPERALSNPEPLNLTVHKFKPGKINAGGPIVRKAESPIHQVNVTVPEHYLTREAPEPVTYDQLAYRKVLELEAVYFGKTSEKI